jgi:hypothetical protein
MIWQGWWADARTLESLKLANEPVHGVGRSAVQPVAMAGLRVALRRDVPGAEAPTPVQVKGRYGYPTASEDHAQ